MAKRRDREGPGGSVNPAEGHAVDAASGALDTGAGGPVGTLVPRDGEVYSMIAGSDAMPPFLMAVASDTDLWMFVTSGGGLTAGRVDPDSSIFPYDTVDKLHDARYHTGPVTLLRVRRGGWGPALWQPFAEPHRERDGLERNIYKTPLGHRVIFEEINHELGLAFRYRWAGGDEFGWVRTATVENIVALPVTIELLDGVRNVLPWGVSQALQQRTSNLVDAYKRSEVDPETGLAVFSLTAGISDRPEALEVLRATTAFCHGLEDAQAHLDLAAVDAFREGASPARGLRLNGRRGSYLVSARLELPPGGTKSWHIALDTGLDQHDAASLDARLREGNGLGDDIEASLRAAGTNLARSVASADGLQTTAHREATAHHAANVLFNIMRGGVFAENTLVPSDDLRTFVGARNARVADRAAEFLRELPEKVDVRELITRARSTGDADLERLSYEYLPVHFGRRHGDPSRPWNRFSIHVRNADGSRALRYEGNWRDIFQNWEALCASFPTFLPNIVAKFVNASTVDGFNPYRVTREGVEWEVPEEENPWSHIGYWGDHQVIYLLKLLEGMTRALPGELERLLDRAVFSYADVPYRLRPYREILKDPASTIDFDRDLDAAIERRVRSLGADGKLVQDDGDVFHVTLLEKLIVPMLSKLSNLVPGGGIWLNTQRPEWNDANNALVGNGVSVVTLCYLRRYVAFLDELLKDVDRAVPVSSEVADWLLQVNEIIENEAAARVARPAGGDDRARKKVMDALGTAFSRYRERVYTSGFSGTTDLETGDVRRLCWAALEVIDAGIRANRRDDGLYHSYVLMELTDGGAGVTLRPLAEMLEGQVAVISSGLLGPEEAAGILEEMFQSRLYREDQRSFMLYPEKRLPGFMERNIVPAEKVQAIPLLGRLLETGEPSIVSRDPSGRYRFGADLRNEDDLAAALERLAEDPAWSDAVREDRASVLELYEDVFEHASYTGRSGAMYAYEGLGSIYWHMVAKLLVAVQEVYLDALDGEAAPETVRRLGDLYYRVRAGLGFEKSPGEYGAFPVDPYSHTPAGGGAKQPGMTGQVKEEILTRWGELGVRIDDGVVEFRPTLLRSAEFLEREDVFEYFDTHGRKRSVALGAGSLAFTYCQVPVVYERGRDGEEVRVLLDDGAEKTIEGDRLDPELSAELLGRTGRIARIQVRVPERTLRDD